MKMNTNQQQIARNIAALEANCPKGKNIVKWFRRLAADMLRYKTGTAAFAEALQNRAAEIEAANA